MVDSIFSTVYIEDVIRELHERVAMTESAISSVQIKRQTRGHLLPTAMLVVNDFEAFRSAMGPNYVPLISERNGETGSTYVVELHSQNYRIILQAIGPHGSFNQND